MSYIQRVFYVGKSPEPVEPVGGATLQWVSFDTGTGTAPAFPIDATFTTAGTITILGIYSSTGELYVAGDDIEPTGVARIQTEDNAELALDTVTAGTASFSTIDCQTDFELPASATSYRGAPQCRMNFRTADGAFTGVLGDYAVGVPAPVVFPVVKPVDEVAADDIDADTRFYVMTYVNANGYESAPGPVNPTAVHVGPDTSVYIFSPQSSDVGYHPAVYEKNIIQDYVPILSARLYRTNTGTTETGYQFITEVGLSNYTFLVEDVENQDLGELLVTEGWDVPPPYVTAGCKMANGTYLLVHEYTVYMSIPGVIYAFPVLYTQVVKDKLLHIEAVGTAAVALTDGGPYLIAGGSPDVMEVVKLPFYQACLSVRAVSVYLDLVIYPAQDGLMGVTAAGKVVNLTEGVFEEQPWREAYDLSDLISEVYDGTYYAWEKSSGNGFAFHIQSRAFQPLDTDLWGSSGSGMTRAVGLKYDGLSDSFYMSDTAGGILYEWEPGGSSSDALSLTDTIMALDPINYWKFDETTGTVADDAMDNGDMTFVSGNFNEAGVSVASTRGDGVGTAVDLSVAALGYAGFQSTGHVPSSSTATLQNGDFTFVGAASLGTPGEGDTPELFGIWSEGVRFGYWYDEASDELRFRCYEAGNWSPVETVVSDCSAMGFSGDTAVWLRMEADVSADIMRVYVNEVLADTVDMSLWTNWTSEGEWRCMSRGCGSYDSYWDFGILDNQWQGVLDEWQYYNKILTAQEHADLYNAWLAPSAVAAPIEWVWHSKEFYIPDRSYGACKLTGVLDATNTVKVILNLDGVDQAAFMIDPTATQPAGVCDGEYTFRLPAVRGSKFILQLSTAAGAPEVHTAQVTVHPTEII